MRKLLQTVAAALLAVIAGNRICRAEVEVRALVIGNNRPFLPASSDRNNPAPLLHFADDDAAAFYELTLQPGESGRLLTVMDRETEAAYPDLARIARPPTIAEVKAAVAALAAEIARSHQRGARTALFIFFSGHGSLADGAGPALALLDGGIDTRFLYDEILDKLPADHVHLLVDSCHAEAVVRPRDVDATRVRVAPEEADAFRLHSTLARYPHLGAIVAAATDAQAHEWDLLRHGVFTHELLSALRGAADVNGDQRLEYSEVYAFMAAANRGIDDPRARLSVVARPPQLDRRTPLFDLSRIRRDRVARITGVTSRAKLVEIEDSTGRRLITLRGEPGFVANLVVPAGRTIYIRSQTQEARVDTVAGEGVEFDAVPFRPSRSRPRGAVEDAFRRGLFAAEFGRGYYAGFIDQATDFAGVSFADPAPAVTSTVDAAVRAAAADRVALDHAGHRILVGLGQSSAVAEVFDRSQGLRVGIRPAASRGVFFSADLHRAAAADLAEWRALGWAGWLTSARTGRLRGWVGGTAGAGAIVQSASGTATPWSAVAAVGPLLGTEASLIGGLGLWAEAQLSLLAYRRDDRLALSLSPMLVMGLSLGL